MSIGTERRRDDLRIDRLLKQAEESHRTHIRTRALMDDILRLNGEQIKLREALEKNTELTLQIATSTQGLVDAWDALSGGIKVLCVAGRVAKWLVVTGGAIGAIWYWFTLRK